MGSVLEKAALKALDERRQQGVSHFDSTRSLPDHAGDFFSNDYLSLSNIPELQYKFIEELKNPQPVFGSAGSRVICGTTPHHVQLEQYFREVFDVRAAMLFNGGYMANLAFFGCVPQTGDVLLHDSLVHASIHDGMRVSRAKDSIIPFQHNSVVDFEKVLKQILREYPRIAAGEATLFVVLESVYSMDGDFCPMREIVDMVERYVPPNALHIAVDEAHSIGIFGPRGLGLVREWGLEGRIHTVIYPFTKGVNFIGAVVTMSPIIYKYIVNYSRPFIYSTSIPHIDLTALRFCVEVIRSPMADQLRSRLAARSHFFYRLFMDATRDISNDVLSLQTPNKDDGGPNQLISPIFPIHTLNPLQLQQHLNEKGYAAHAMAFPVVPRGKERIRVVIHAGNSEQALKEFMEVLRGWALKQTSTQHDDCIRSKL